MTDNIIIKQVSNGVIIESPHPMTSDTLVEVYEFDEHQEETSEYNVNKQRDILFAIKEALGFYGSKHDEYRCFITVEKQE